jgi:protein-S-isoprenylcysteine O-methyltransferase Ste14
VTESPDLEVPLSIPPPRDAAKVRIFPPGAPLLTVLIGVGLNRLWSIEFLAVLPRPFRIALGVGIIAAALFLLGLRAVIRVRTSGQSENPWKPTTRIIEDGPFRFTRNPMYLQMVIGCVGFAIALANAWILLLTPVCAWTLQRFAILPEEAYLERKFGAEYLAYKRRVPRWL